MDSTFPNADPKPVGAYVEHVHPCASDEHGIVLQSEAGADEPGTAGTLYVRTGIGSTTYGPARNWRLTETRPSWVPELEQRRERGRTYVGAACTLDGRPATISGRLEPFATVAEVPDGPSYSYSWEAVTRVMELSRGGFRS